MTSEEILAYYEKNNAITTDKHFVFTSGVHSASYMNMRAVAHDARWMREVSKTLAERIKPLNPDIIVGPETLGRTLCGFVAAELNIPGIWCSMDGDEAEFIAKLDFGRLIPGKKVVIVDDLLAAGSTIRKVVAAVEKLGGEVIAAAVVINRSLNVTAETCNVPKLITLVEVDGSQSEPEDCELCAQKVPMTLRPGHGHAWIKSHPDYPVAE